MNNQSMTAAIAEPYAEALLSLSQDTGKTDQFSTEISGILEALEASQDLRQMLVNPFVQPEAKKSVLNQLLGSQVDASILKFINLLVDRRRVMYIIAIFKHYQTLVRQARNIILAEVTSASALTEGQREAVINKVKAMTGAGQVELATQLDPDLIGGVVIKVGSQVLDASIRGQLRRLSNSLLSSV